MSAPKPETEAFTQNWNKAAAWAQQQGISMNSLQPIYEMDLNRLQSGYPMSTAERYNSIVAANNPNDVTPAPQDNPNPSNVFGNSVRDLQAIFTGLDPTKLVPNLYDTVKNTLEAVVDPNKEKGANLGTTAANWMQNTLLSFVPGVYDIGTFLRAEPNDKGFSGFEALAENPVTSLLDVAPAAGKLLGAAADAGMLSRVADRAGMTSSELAESSATKVMANLIMNTPAKKLHLGPEIMADPSGLRGIIQTPTLGDVIQNWMQNSPLGTSKYVQQAALAYGIGNQLATNIFVNEVSPAADALNALSPEETAAYQDLTYKATHGEDIQPLLEDPSVTTPVKEAVLETLRGPIQFSAELSVASGQVAAARLPSGAMSLVSRDEAKEILTTRDALHQAHRDYAEELLPTDQLKKDIDALQNRLPELLGSLREANHAASRVIPKLWDEENPIATRSHQAAPAYGKTKTPKERNLVYGKKADEARKVFGTGGWVEQIIQAATNGDDDTLAALLPMVKGRLTKWGHESVDATNNPAFLAVKAQLELFERYSDQLNHMHDALSDKIVGDVHASYTETKEKEDYARRIRDETKKRHQSEQFKLRLYKKWSKERIASNLETQVKSLQEIQDSADKRLNDSTKNLIGRQNMVGSASSVVRMGFDKWRAYEQARGFSFASDNQARTLYAAWLKRSKSVADSADSISKKNHIKLRDEVIKAKKKAETDSLRHEIDFAKKRKQLDKRQASELEDVEGRLDVVRTYNGELMDKMMSYLQSVANFSDAVYDHPSDVWRDKLVDLVMQGLMDHEHTAQLMDETDRRLIAAGKTKSQVEQLHKDPQKIRELLYVTARDVLDNAENVDPELVGAVKRMKADVVKSGKDQLAILGAEGFQPEWFPHAGPLQSVASGIRIIVGKGEPTVDAAFTRAFDLTPTRHNVMLGATKSVAQALEQATYREFVENYIVPRTITGSEVLNFLRGKTNILENWDPKTRNLTGEEVKALDDLGLVEFNPSSIFGFRRPSWGSEKLFLPKGLAKALDKLSSEGGKGKMRGALDKTNKVYRYSILGLSPRYTAHIVFGGTFMLMARSGPDIFKVLPNVARAMREGTIPPEVFRTPAEEGVTSITMLKNGLQAHGVASGKQQATLVIQENIETKQGVKLALAKPVHILKAMADINFRFTHAVTRMQSAAAYMDYAAAAERRGTFTDLVTGEEREMTKERAMYEGMQHVAEVYGDLRSMSPLERSIAHNIMPFYGWQRHILKYVLSYPADHPWRAMILGLMSYENSEAVPKGLPERIQFLFYLGTPDAEGNVSAIDTRFMDPFRDTANYATLQGWIQALNPAILAPIAMVDPQIVYGSNELYPNITYNQLYGIDVAGSQGNIVTGLQQFIPQISALSGAFDAATQQRSLAKTDPAAFTKSVFNSLNIPFAQVQNINLKQMAAQDEIARYDAAKQAANNAWTTGDFSYLNGYASVPNPIGNGSADVYDITPAQLQAVYNQALANYPGVAPSAVVAPPPLPPGF